MSSDTEVLIANGCAGLG